MDNTKLWFLIDFDSHNYVVSSDLRPEVGMLSTRVLV